MTPEREARQFIDEQLEAVTPFKTKHLKRDFEGKFLPQDPNDESVEKLLERIKAEKK